MKTTIETTHETLTTMYCVEIICSKMGKVTLLVAYLKKEDAKRHAEYWIRSKYDEYFGIIYDANVMEGTIIL